MNVARGKVSHEVVAEILAAQWQLMVLQRGQNLLELEEELLAWRILVGIHVPLELQLFADAGEPLLVGRLEQRGRGDGDGLVAS